VGPAKATIANKAAIAPVVKGPRLWLTAFSCNKYGNNSASHTADQLPWLSVFLSINTTIATNGMMASSQ
jgi:hypothetical protein